jgi:hypothetical protein
MGRGVLDHPLSRGMTTETVARASQTRLYALAAQSVRAMGNV